MIAYTIVHYCVTDNYFRSDHQDSGVDTRGEFGINLALHPYVMIILIEQPKHSQIFLEILFYICGIHQDCITMMQTLRNSVIGRQEFY